MSFKSLKIEDEYRSDMYPNLGNTFISYVLGDSVVYKRAVGFFSSSCLLSLTHGLSKFVGKTNCKIQLVVSPFLSKEDIDAIKQGYTNRSYVDKIIEDVLIKDFKDVDNPFDKERLNLLCHLIEQGILDIKIAAKINGTSFDDIGMFHEKSGIFIDSEDNKIAFTGSLNESDNAYENNFESIQVFKSWEEPKRVIKIEDNFDRLWENKTNTLKIFEFPDALKCKLFKYKRKDVRLDIDDWEKEERIEIKQITLPSCNFPHPYYEYQKDAINSWAHHHYRGIFDMGTGTGKTVTALTASVKLLERLHYKLATIIVCPYTHLVDQWVEDQEYFNINFIVGYSSNKHKNYIYELEQAVQDYNDGIIDYFYFITTNASYRTKKVQDVLNSIKRSVLFIADEVHNFGSTGLQEVMNENYNFRLGLSATVDRHRDLIGTQAIRDYFGETCISYGLKEAIENDVLTRYYYHVIPVYLNEDEQLDYIELTRLIGKNSYPSKDGLKLTKSGEFYALKRARIIAAAQNKLLTLKDTIKDYKDKNNLLIYCGTGKVKTDDGVEEKQIDEVCKMLGNELGMKIARYTSREETDERKNIADRYKKGELQALVAIKCLDEGVNIPSIETAFILASSTNPREYIQRRGRVLRKFEGKKYSYIYDFVTLPVPFEEIKEHDPAFIDSFKALAKNEVSRMQEFASLAENGHEADSLINKIINEYELNKFENDDNFEEIEWSDSDE